MKKLKLDVEVGKEVTLFLGETNVTGRCLGLRVDPELELEAVWVEGFLYNSFTIGEPPMYWQVKK